MQHPRCVAWGECGKYFSVLFGNFPSFLSEFNERCLDLPFSPNHRLFFLDSHVHFIIFSAILSLFGTGLDYFRHLDKSSPEVQKRVFIRQIEMAIKHNKPIGKLK